MKARDKVYDAAESIKPYVERAMADEKLRDDVMHAFGTAREIYRDLVGEKSAVTLASREEAAAVRSIERTLGHPLARVALPGVTEQEPERPAVTPRGALTRGRGRSSSRRFRR